MIRSVVEYVVIIAFVIFVIVYCVSGLSVQEMSHSVVEYIIVVIMVITVLCCASGLSVQKIAHNVVEYVIIIIIIAVIIILCCVPGLSVQEMVHCAVEYGSPCEVDHVTFGEFCVLVDELRHKYETDSIAALPCAILPSKARGVGSSGRRKRKGGRLQEFGNTLNTQTGFGNPARPTL